MYFQNLVTRMAPQPLPNGARGWAMPIDPSARVMHCGDATEVGRAVAAAFAAGDQLPDGSYLVVCGGIYSFNDIVGTLNEQGHTLQCLRVLPSFCHWPGVRGSGATAGGGIDKANGGIDEAAIMSMAAGFASLTQEETTMDETLAVALRARTETMEAISLLGQPRLARKTLSQIR